jgi:hypothetical protein
VAVTLSFGIEDKGILPDRMIAALAADGAILSENKFVPDQIQPASLDLRLGEVAYRVRASFLPGRTTVPGASTSSSCTRFRWAMARFSKLAASILCRCRKAWHSRMKFRRPPIQKARPDGSMYSRA